MVRTTHIAVAGAVFTLCLGAHGFADYAFVWANNPTATTTYVPSSSYQYNSSGATNTVRRVRQGFYRVLMPNMQPTGRGNVQVTAYGSSSIFCNVGGWYKTGIANLDVYVYCFDGGGNPADSQFTALYHDNLPSGEDLAYVWADQPTWLTYNPEARYSHNSEWSDPSESILIERVDVGVYRLRFWGWDPLRQHPVTGLWDRTDGNVQLTTYDRGPNRCQVTRQQTYIELDGVPAYLFVVVECSTLDLDPVDTRFALAVSRDRVPGFRRTIGAYVNVLLRESTLLPYVDASFNPLTPLAAPVVTRRGVGRYRVQIPGLAYTFTKSTVQVTARSRGISAPVWDPEVLYDYLVPTDCKVVSWPVVGDGVRVDVDCYDSVTVPKRRLDSAFYLSFVTDASY